MTESALWYQWLGDHDESAFAALVGPHLSFMFDYARRSGCNPSDADEVVQSALCELLRQRSDKPCRVGFRAWLARSARSHVRMLWRARRRRDRHEGRARKPAWSSTDPIEAQDEVSVALAKLDPEARELVTLRFLHDLEYSEIGAIVGRTPNACRIRVHRALERLRADLGRGAPALIAALPLFAQDAAGAVIPRALGATPKLPTAKWLGAGAAAPAVSVLMVAVGVSVIAVLTATTADDSELRARRARVEAGAASTRAHMDAADGTARASSENAPVGRATAVDTTTGAATGSQADGAPPSETLCHLTGTFRFDDDKPLAKAVLSVGGVRATTDNNGRITVSFKPAARTTIWLQLVGSDRMTLAEFVHPGRDHSVERKFPLMRGSEVSARVVTDDTSAPIEEARLTLRAVDRDPAQARDAFVTADAEGNVRIPYVPDGEYRITVSHKGYRAHEIQISVPQQYELGDIVLKRAASMSVRIEGAPREAIGAEIRWSMGRPGGYGSREAATLDQNFSFVVPEPRRGSYTLTIHANRVLPRLEHHFYYYQRRNGPTRIVVTHPPGAAVEGVLRGPDGEPARRAPLEIDKKWENRAASRQAYTRARLWQVRTDATGRFRFPKVCAGDVRLTLLTARGRIDVGSVRVPDGGRVGVDARIPGRCTVRGRVETEPPEQQVLIEIRRSNESHPIATLRTRYGSREFEIGHLPEGRLEVRASSHLGTPAVKIVELVCGEPLDAELFKIEKYPRVQAQVIVPAGHAMPRMLRVWVDAKWTGAVRIDPSGTCELVSVPPGRHTVRVSASPFNPTNFVVINSPDLPRLRIEFTATDLPDGR